MEVRDRVDGHAVNVPVPLGGGSPSGHMPLDQRMLGRMAGQLANILETLKTKEMPRQSYTQDITQGREGAVMGPSKACSLSGRQVEILCKVAEGMSNKEIAAQLNVSDQTIKNHMTHILDKLYANDRTHAVVLAFRLGLLDLEGAPSQ